MSLLIDERESTDLRRHLSAYDLSIDVCHLDFGDAFFEGSGPSDSPVLIGIERKRLPDLIASIETRRLAGHQLRGMYNTYDYCYLVVEGFWRPSQSGSIEVFEGSSWKPLYHQRKSILYRQVDSYLDSLSTSDPRVVVCRTVSTYETAALYASRYHHWQKPWSSRHSRDVIYAPSPDRLPGRVHFGDPPIVAKLAAQLPGIDRKAWAVARHFPSAVQMVLADASEWRKIDGIGAKISKEIVDVLAGKRT